MPAAKTGDGGSIAYPKIGTGPTPVLLLHDWLVSGSSWQDFLPSLPKDRYTVMLPDQRGTGFSFHPEAGYTLDRYAEDMIGLMAEEKDFTRKWIVVGHGFGGLVAQRLAILYGRKIGGLVLAAPMPLGGLAAAGAIGAAIQAALRDRSQLAGLLPLLFGSAPEESTLEILREDIESTSDICIREAAAVWQKGGDTEKLSKIRCPALVIGAEKDTLVPAATIESEVAGRLPGATYKTYPGCGHMIPFEAPARLAADLDAFAAEPA